MRHHLVLLLLDGEAHALGGGVRLQVELPDLARDVRGERLELQVAAPGGSQVVLGALHRRRQHVVLRHALVQHLRDAGDLRREDAHLLVGAHPSGARHLSLQLLDLKLRVVQVLLLAHHGGVELQDLVRHVFVLGLPAGDLGDQVALLGAQAEQLLRRLEHQLLQAHAFLGHRGQVALVVALDPCQLGAALLQRHQLHLLVLQPLLRHRQLLAHRLQPLALLLKRLAFALVARLGLHQVPRRLAQRVLHHLHLVLHLRLLRHLALLHQPQLAHPAVRDGDARVQLLVVVHLLFQEPCALVQGRLRRADHLLLRCKRLGRLLDGLVPPLHRLHRLLPLPHQLLPLVVQAAEILRSLVQLDLRRLRLRHLALQLRLLGVHLLGHLLDGQVQLLDARVVGALVLLQRQVVLLLLPRRQRPLLQLLLIPVHEQLELIQALVAAVHPRLQAGHLVAQVHLLLLQLAHLVPHARDGQV
mmetsp:Transcript_34864/g.85366  ORF Transcript_34864/g.85366 Transcript_34864/m.85366 type:complete len:472 (-) Transcript_34864:396-1811(-)